MEEALIVAVCARPELYDTTNYYYRDRDKKDLAWRRVSEETGLSEPLCRKKWKGLRDTYLKERRKELERKSGAAAEQLRRWRFSAVLSFLDPYVTPRPTSSNMSQVEEEAAEDLPAVAAQDQELDATSDNEEQDDDEENDERPRSPLQQASQSRSPLQQASQSRAPMQGGPGVSSSSRSEVPGPSTSAAAAAAPAAAPTRRRKRAQTAQPRHEPSLVEQQLLEALRERRASPAAQPQQFSPVEHYLLSLAPSLEKLSFYDLEVLKVKINKVIFDHCTVVLNLEHSAENI